MHHKLVQSRDRNMANLKLSFLAIYFLGAWGPVLCEGVEKGSGAVSGSLVREPRGFIKRRLCQRYGICGQNGGGYGGYQGGYQQGGYPGQIPAINIGISQSQSSASNGQGGGYSGNYPNNYQYNQGYPGYGGYNQGYGGYNQGYGGQAGYGGYGQRPGYFGNGNGGYNNQFNGNYNGGNGGGGYGFQGGPFGFDEYADDINGGNGVQNDDASTANTDINGAPVGNYDQGQSDNAEAGSFAFAGRKNN